METCLITGANGFIGTKLVEQAKEAGLHVLAAVRKTSNLEQLLSLGVEIVYVDYTNFDTMRSSLAPYKFDYVIHNAGLTKTIDSKEFYKVNVLNTKHLIDAILSNKIPIKKFVFISSLAAFGPSDLQPDGLVSNSSIPHPVTEYGRSKLEAEKVVQEYEDFPYIFIRPTAVYGPGEKDLFQVFEMVKSGFVFLAKVKNQMATFVHVDDLTNVILKAMFSSVIKDGFFVTDGQEYATLDFPKVIGKVMHSKYILIALPIFFLKFVAFISESISKITKKPTPINLDKVNEFKAKSWACDMDYTIKSLGYTPQILLEHGVKDTLNYYKKNNLL
ncbi:MAG: NAD(P)-dependent oxidoreductase [Saprospiraceae bacterium]